MNDGYKLVIKDGNVMNDGYELVRKDGNVIAYYPIIKLEQLKENFKFKKICKPPEFQDYDSLDDFIYSIYFLEFLEYFLDYLHFFFPDVISYKKDKSKMTKDETFFISTVYFGSLINYAYRYLFYTENIKKLLIEVKSNYKKLIEIISEFSQKEQRLLIELYTGFIYFLELLTRNGKLDNGMSLFITLKNNVMKGKLNKNKQMFNQSKLSEIFELFKIKNIMKYRKDLLYKFKLFQRKYISEIAKLRKIGSPSASKEESKQLKKELNKNKNIDYKAYEMFCKYVIDKIENESIYDYLAGIHKNSSGAIIHKNIKNENVNKVKINTKKTQHIEYVEKSKKILEEVEEKIGNHKDIIPKQIKSEVLRISKLFKSNEYKNTNISFSNNTNNTHQIGIGGKIIQDCKRIRAINKEINKLTGKKQEGEKQRKYEEREQHKKPNKLTQEELNFLSNLVNKHPNIKNIEGNKQRIYRLLLKYHPNKTSHLPANEKLKRNNISTILIRMLDKL
jgi:hypothetical protein